MKKMMYVVALFMQVSMLQATWIIVSIDNQSDLKLLQAMHNNNLEIPSISQLFQHAQNSHVSLDPENYFGSVGACKIIAQMPSGEQVTLAFFGDPTNQVANGRAQYADLDSRNAANPWKQDRMARVMMIQGNQMKLIGFTGYQVLNQKMNLKITGADGKYVALLTLA